MFMITSMIICAQILTPHKGIRWYDVNYPGKIVMINLIYLVLLHPQSQREDARITFYLIHNGFIMCNH